MTDRNLNVKVNADARQASAEIGNLADEVAEVEGTHTARVEADAGDVTDEVRQAKRSLDDLTDEQRAIVLKAQSDQLQTEIRRAERAVGRLKDDDAIVVRMEARDRASAELDRVQAELRELDGATANVAVETRGVDDLFDKLDQLPGRFGDMSRNLVASLATPQTAIAGTVAGLALLGDQAADTALQAKDLATLTGDSVEQASRLNTVWSQTGADVKDLQDVLLQMGGVLNDNAELAAQLGININDGRTLGERFVQVVEAVRTNIDGATAQAVTLSQVFGEEGVRQVNTLLNLVGDLDAALADVNTGQVITDDDVEQAREYKAEMAELKNELGEFAVTIGTAVLPALGLLTEGLNFTNESVERVGTSIGQNLRHIFDGGDAHRNREFVEGVEAAERAAREFDRSLLDNATTVDEVRAITREYGLELHAQNLIVVEWTNAQRDAEAAAEAAGDAAEEAGEQVRSSGDGIRAATDAWRELATAASEAADAAVQAADDAASAAFDDAGRQLDLQRQQIELDRQVERTRQARVAALEAEAEGADDAAAKAQQYRLEQLTLESDLLRYIQLLGDVPPARYTEIRALIDSEQYAEAQRQIDELVADRFTRVVVQVDPEPAPSFDAVRFTVGAGGASRPQYEDRAPSQTIIYNPPGSPTTVRTSDRTYEQRNGIR